MQRQAVSRTQMGFFDVADIESATHQSQASYRRPSYNEVDNMPPRANLALAPQNTHPVQEAAVQILLGLIRAGFCLSVSSSFGKDSTCCVVLLIEAVRRAVAEGIQRTHHVSLSSTGIENPAMEWHAMRCLDEVREHCEQHGLPVEVHTVYPSLASSFVVTTIGRGTLPRTPENGKSRQCSVDWKVLPQQRLLSDLEARVAAENGRGIVTVIGTRLAESSARSERMNERGESASTPVLSDQGYLVLSPIANWTLEDVWNTIEMIADPDSSPYLTPISAESVERLMTLYREANDGVCGVVLGDGGNRAPCSSRFGCSFCTVSGAKDKSMESMLENDRRYDYMRPLNAFRNLLVSAQFDFELREIIGRKVSPSGYLSIGPNAYSLGFRKTLLWLLLSMDADERDRAERMADDIACGRVADTRDNRMLASPMFENVSLQQLAIIDFHWSMHAHAECAFPALSIWYEVNHLGRRRHVVKRAKAPKLTVPTKRWFKVGNYDHDNIPAEGLRSRDAEAWNRHRKPERPLTYREVDGMRTVWFDEEENLTVDAIEACAFITCTYPSMAVESRMLPASESAKWWLNEGIIKLPQGHAGRYQEIARRNQYFGNLAEKLDLSPKELDSYLLKHSITNKEHENLLAAAVADASGIQHDLFAQPLAA